MKSWDTLIYGIQFLFRSNHDLSTFKNEFSPMNRIVWAMMEDFAWVHILDLDLEENLHRVCI